MVGKPGCFTSFLLWAPLFLLLPLWFASGKWGDGRDAVGGRPGSVTLRLVVCKFCIKALLPSYLFSELNFSDRAVTLRTQRPSRLYERTVPGSHKLPLNIPPPQLHWWKEKNKRGSGVSDKEQASVRTAAISCGAKGRLGFAGRTTIPYVFRRWQGRSGNEYDPNSHPRSPFRQIPVILNLRQVDAQWYPSVISSHSYPPKRNGGKRSNAPSSGLDITYTKLFPLIFQGSCLSLCWKNY